MKTRRAYPHQTSLAATEHTTLHDYWITLVVVVALSSFSLVCFVSAIAKFSHAVILTTQQPQVPEPMTHEALSYLD